jgi:hypothetical protein
MSESVKNGSRGLAAGCLLRNRTSSGCLGMSDKCKSGSRQFSITSFAWGEQFAGMLRQSALCDQYMHADEIKIVNIST